MDAGVDAGTMKTVALMIADGDVPQPSSFSVEQLCDICDEMVAREVEYFYGESLAETIFTNV
jgi:hypothetical protein